MSKFTPGPWRVNKYGGIGAGEFGTTPVVAEVEPFYGTDAQYGSHAANRQLIAAAPEMLDALRLTRDYVKAELEHRMEAYAGYPHKWSSEQDDLAVVDAAIAKATGEA